MSNALVRRNSSKQGLQNLIRLTAQRSVEDAEEVERERRRRAREEGYHRNSDAAPPEYASNQTDSDDTFQGVVKPNSSPSLEEDEGFSDWTQRRQQRRQQRLEEVAKGGREHCETEERNRDTHGAPSEGTITSSCTSSSSSNHESQVEKREPGEVSHTSEDFLFQVSKPDGDTSREEVSSYPRTQSKSRFPRCSETSGIVEVERRTEKIHRGLQEKECRELEQLKHRNSQAELELEELARRRELRRGLKSEEERRRQDDERLRATKEEEERRRMKEDIERRRMDAAVRMKSWSGDSGDTDKAFSPIKTPTHKITERTESLNRSLKKSNSFKKTTAIVPVRIDDKMEQYAHAVETSQEPRGLKPSVVDFPNSLEAVTSKKNLFEAGDMQTSSPPKTSSCRDTDGLKVGVANLINQLVKGQPNISRPTQSQVTDVKYGDVMQKKNMWEIIGDSTGKSAADIKGSAAVSKKFKFVVTGHGKYEKISVNQENEADEKCDGCQSDY
ncbi:uncharacterized protein LOC144215993 isoform X1 [Stigmatopora nigra]